MASICSAFCRLHHYNAAHAGLVDGAVGSTKVEKFFGVFKQIKALDLPKTEILPPFEGVYASFYDDSFRRFKGDIEWYLGHANEKQHEVLDLGCGSGRTVIPFAYAGHEVTGIDLSKDMLQRGRSKIKAIYPEIASRITLIEDDALTLDLERTFEYAVIGGLTIPLLSTAQQRKLIFATAQRHLHPRGVLLFDYLPVISGEQPSESYFVVPARAMEKHGFMLLGCYRNPGENYQVTNLYTEFVSSTGETNRFLSSTACTLLNKDELDAELTEVGFKIVDSKDIYMDAEATPSSSTQNWPTRLIACRPLT